MKIEHDVEKVIAEWNFGEQEFDLIIVHRDTCTACLVAPDGLPDQGIEV